MKVTVSRHFRMLSIPAVLGVLSLVVMDCKETASPLASAEEVKKPTAVADTIHYDSLTFDLSKISVMIHDRYSSTGTPRGNITIDTVLNGFYSYSGVLTPGLDFFAGDTMQFTSTKEGEWARTAKIDTVHRVLSLSVFHQAHSGGSFQDGTSEETGFTVTRAPYTVDALGNLHITITDEQVRLSQLSLVQQYSAWSDPSLQGMTYSENSEVIAVNSIPVDHPAQITLWRKK